MNKELTPLEALKEIVDFENELGSDFSIFHKRNLEIIEKSLKALEIIKKKQVDVGELLGCILLEIQDYVKDALEEFNCHLLIHNQLTKEEFNLLKEVLL